MKNKFYLITAVSLMLMNFSVFGQGINFNHDKWDDVLQKAKQEKKLIMMDAFASWCGPCKWMAKNTFTDSEVGKFYNNNFVCVKIDMEKGEGLQLRKKYTISAYPTIFFIDGTGKKVHEKIGALGASDFITLGKKALTMFKPEENNNSNSGINFNHGKWVDVLKKAKQDNKLIMMDAYASWCGPCKWMAKNTFTDSEVGKFYNENFISVKIDMEKGEGLQLRKKYTISAYPTIFFIDGTGKKIHEKIGALGASDFITLGKKALALFKPNVKNETNTNYIRFKNRWKGTHIHIENGKAENGEIQNQWQSAMWTFEKVEGSKYFKIKNRLKGTYLNIEHGNVESSEIQVGWHSAMWELENVSGTTFFRVKNRWKGTYLHIENGKPECSDTDTGWHSAMWEIKPVR